MSEEETIPGTSPAEPREVETQEMSRGFVDKLRADKPSDLSISQEAMRRLMSYAWPGNVRQLENAIERALAMLGSRTQIEVTDLPPDLHSLLRRYALSKPVLRVRYSTLANENVPRSARSRKPNTRQKRTKSERLCPYRQR